MKKNYHNVLWTGGWDSTYRILDLTIVKGRSIQPYYVLDDGRASQSIEIKTMNRIKEMVDISFPAAKGLIRDTIYFKRSEIPANKAITDKWQRLRDSSFMGSQYEWLGRYAEENGINNFELCIHQDDKASFFLDNHVEKHKDNNDDCYHLKDSEVGTDLDLFKYYNFPILELTKTDMQEDARRHGFDAIMEETWFCFNPTWRSTPCGNCNPCKYTKEEGLGRRVPIGILAKYNRIENLVYYRIKKLLSSYG